MQVNKEKGGVWWKGRIWQWRKKWKFGWRGKEAERDSFQPAFSLLSVVPCISTILSRLLLFCHRFLISSLLFIPISFSVYHLLISLFLPFRETLFSLFCNAHCPWRLSVQHFITFITPLFDYNLQHIILTLLFTFMFVLQEKYCCADDNYGFLPFLGFSLHNSHCLLTECFTVTPL